MSAALVCCFTTFATIGFAHGPAPAALGALVDEAGALGAIHTNIGLAIPREEGGYRYICPIQWGEEDRFPAPFFGADNDIRVPGQGILYSGDGCTFRGVPIEGWEGQLGGQHGGRLLERLDAGARFWDARGTPQILGAYSGDIPVDSVFSNSSELGFATSRGVVQVYTLDRDGRPQALELTGAPRGDYARLMKLDPVWVTVSQDAGRTIHAAADGEYRQVLPTAHAAVHGPVFAGEDVALVADGVLYAGVGLELDAVRQVDWACLFQSGEQVYACQERGLVRVQPGTWEAGAVAFSLEEIQGLDPECPEADGTSRVTCERQWLHFAGEAGLLRGPGDGFAGAGGDQRAGDSHGGCSLGSGRPDAWVGLGLLLYLLAARRVRG